MKPLISAIRTLTTIPVPGKDTDKFEKSLPYFPLVGAILSIFPLGIYYLYATYFNAEPEILSFVALFLVIIFTGALHIDGLGDVADAIGGGANDRERIFTILKDSRMGTFGIVAIVSDIIIKWQLWIWAFENSHPSIIVLSLVLGRSSQVLYVLFGKPAKNDGIAVAFSTQSFLIKFLSLLLIIIISISFLFVYNWQCLSTLFISMIVATGIVALYFKRKIGGYTGDCLGTANEITENIIIIIFFIISIIY